MKKLLSMVAVGAIASFALVGRADAQSRVPSRVQGASGTYGTYGTYPSQYPSYPGYPTYPGQYPQQYPTTSQQRRARDHHERRDKDRDRDRDRDYDRGSNYGYGTTASRNGVPSRVEGQRTTSRSRGYDNDRRDR